MAFTKKLSRSMRLVCIVFVASITLYPFTNAGAALQNYNGNGKVIHDDVNDIYWYAQMHELTGMTYDQQMAAIPNLPEYDGIGNWQMATADQVSDLFVSAGVAPFGNSDRPIYDAWSAVGGLTSADRLEARLDQPGFFGGGHMTAYQYESGWAGFPPNAGTLDDSYSSTTPYGIGAWVVGTPVGSGGSGGSVPEPSTYAMALLASGIATVVTRRRRTKQASRKET